MERLKSLNKEQIFTAVLITIIGLDFIFLISSQTTKEWYKGGDHGCEWKGSSSEVYSGDCYSHKSYTDTKCRHCDCCDDQRDLDKLGHSILPFIILIIFNSFWLLTLIINLKKQLDLNGYFLKLSKIFTIPAAFLAVIFFSVESFGITDEKVQAGLVLRVISIIIFCIFTICLFWYNNDNLRDIKKESLFRNNVNPMSILDSGSRDGLVNKSGNTF